MYELGYVKIGHYQVWRSEMASFSKQCTVNYEHILSFPFYLLTFGLHSVSYIQNVCD